MLYMYIGVNYAYPPPGPIALTLTQKAMEKKTALLVMALVSFDSALFAQKEQDTGIAQSVPRTDLMTELAFAPEDEFSPTLYDDHFNNRLLNPTFGNEPTVSIDPVNDVQITAGRAHLRKLIYSSGLLFVSGFSDATSEVLKIKYGSFERVFTEAGRVTSRMALSIICRTPQDSIWRMMLFLSKYRLGRTISLFFLSFRTSFS